MEPINKKIASTTPLKKFEWSCPKIFGMSTALTEGKSYGGIEASPLKPPGPS